MNNEFSKAYNEQLSCVGSRDLNALTFDLHSLKVPDSIWQDRWISSQNSKSLTGVLTVHVLFSLRLIFFSNW